MTFDLLRRLQALFCKSKEKRVIVQVHPDVSRRLRTENKSLLDDVAKEFFDRARELGDKLGPILIQLGADFKERELPALAQFLPTLPQDIAFAIEFRDRSWIHDGIVATSSATIRALSLGTLGPSGRTMCMPLAPEVLGTACSPSSSSTSFTHCATWMTRSNVAFGPGSRSMIE